MFNKYALFSFLLLLTVSISSIAAGAPTDTETKNTQTTTKTANVETAPTLPTDKTVAKPADTADNKNSAAKNATANSGDKTSPKDSAEAQSVAKDEKQSQPTTDDKAKTPSDEIAKPPAATPVKPPAYLEPALPIPPKIKEIHDEVINREQVLIIIDKSEHRLYLFKNAELIRSYPVALGANPGQKTRTKDKVTPTGKFTVAAIYNSTNWPYTVNEDEPDNQYVVYGVFGPWFISLNTGWDGIGIHGTNNPDSIGTNSSAGCIRMYSSDVTELKSLISVGTAVVIAY